MSDNSSSKTQLRGMLRQRRHAISTSRQQFAAQALIQSVVKLPAWENARCIALYMAADGEIDSQPLATLARKAGKQVFLPTINSDRSLSFALWSHQDVLSSNQYGICEPLTGVPVCPVADLNIICLPLVGWDRSGGRLGMGGGFYDRTLSAVTGPLLVGLAHDCQQVDELPRDSWDVRMHYVATEVALYHCKG